MENKVFTHMQMLSDETDIDLFFTLGDENTDSWFGRDRMAWGVIKEVVRNYPEVLDVCLEVNYRFDIYGVRKWGFTFCGKHIYDVLDPRTACVRALEYGAAFDDKTKAVIMDMAEHLML